MSAQALWSGPIVGIAGKCLDLTNQNNGTKAWLWTCYGGINQAFTGRGDGTIQSTPVRKSPGVWDFACLDADGNRNDNGTPVLAWTCHGNANQDWVHRPDGSLTNPRTGLFVDVNGGHTHNENTIHLWSRIHAPQQRWAIPVRAS